MKRNGTAVFLMEMIIILLFFSLSVVVTLRLFATSYVTNQRSTDLNEALRQAQNTAEQFYAAGDGSFSGSVWTVSESDGYNLYENTGHEESGLIIKVFLKNDYNSYGKSETGKVQVYSRERPAEGLLCELQLAKYNSGNNSGVTP